MASHKAGRPTKSDQNKRQQLHISLYADDLERLDHLTDNRSEFLRQCIAKAWEEQAEAEATVSITVLLAMHSACVLSVAMAPPVGVAHPGRAGQYEGAARVGRGGSRRAVRRNLARGCRPPFVRLPGDVAGVAPCG